MMPRLDERHKPIRIVEIGQSYIGCPKTLRLPARQMEPEDQLAQDWESDVRHDDCGKYGAASFDTAMYALPSDMINAVDMFLVV
mmetsp:Transcript_8879/g.21560  ORF Transcript_8879/g.21560 Transcript_8879/m.21560 type:complete len:84 (-) Transcript_8879:335-586(-)